MIERRWREHAWLNRLQSALLLAAMGAILMLISHLLFGRQGMIGLLAGVSILMLFNPVVSPYWIMRLYNARPVGPRAAPALDEAVRVFSERAGLPAPPVLYYIPSPVLNAFAVGHPGRSAIALTDGMLRTLDGPEIAGVLAHEISHIRNNDLWVMGVADTFSRLTAAMSLFGQLLLLINLPLIVLTGGGISWPAIVLLIVSPTLSTLVQLGLSRTREYNADLNAARLTGDPRGLARALQKMERHGRSVWERVVFPGRGTPEPSLLRTHPPTDERVRRLMQLEPDAGPQPPALPPGPPFHPSPPVRRRPRWRIGGLWY